MQKLIIMILTFIKILPKLLFHFGMYINKNNQHFWLLHYVYKLKQNYCSLHYMKKLNQNSWFTLLYEKSEPRGIFNGLNDMLRNTGQAEEYGEQGRLAVHKKYSNEQLAKELVENILAPLVSTK